MDEFIIRELEIDARISYRKIASKLNVSVGTIHNRIKKMKNSGILKGFMLDLDESMIGYKLKFLIMLSIDGKYTSDVLERISRYPQITTIFHVAGEQSAALICRFKDMDEVQNFIRILNEEPHVIKTVSNLIFSVFKEDEHHLFSDNENNTEDERLESQQATLKYNQI